MRSSGKNRSPRAPPPLLAPVLLLIFGLSLLQRPASAEKKSYVVYLGCHSHGREGAALASNQERAKNSHYQFLGSVLGSEEEAQDAIFYSYTRYINGFAATLEEEDAMQISRHPSVVSVFPNRGHRLHTTRSWEFLGMEKDGRVRPNSVWARARYGEGVIIGNLDTGVWPEAGSFSDDGMGPVPARWRGVCHDQSSSDDAQVRCNSTSTRGTRRQWADGAGASPAGTGDSDGHGTHTLSTAAGRFVPGANLFGYGNGTAKGGAAGARVAAYKVCWRPVNGSECFDADIIAAFDAAIHDGWTSSPCPRRRARRLLQGRRRHRSFHAVRNGVTVVTSAGNSGPGAGTVSNTAPWLVTVGRAPWTASSRPSWFSATRSRSVPSFRPNHLRLLLLLTMPISGQSLSPVPLPANKQYRLISSVEAKAADATASQAELCMEGSLDRKKAEGKIVVCMRGKNARVEKGEEVHRAGGVGLVLANDEATGNEMIADAHVLPATHITYSDGVALLAYMNSTRFASGYITLPNTALETKPAPFMAAFSSQGPNTVTPQILKVRLFCHKLGHAVIDHSNISTAMLSFLSVRAVSILAAFTGLAGPTGLTFDSRRVRFNSESGTSMSCPHVAGIAGLLKALHPNWSPAAIKSAIMTTARVQDNTRRPMSNSSFQRATPFAYGAGHVQPNRAADLGLVYDMNATDYLHFLCALGYNSTVIDTFMAGDDGPHACSARPRKAEDLNYLSVTAPHLSASGEPHTVTRRVRNVGATPAAYDVRVNEPRGVSVSVQPNWLEFAAAGRRRSSA
ncbi:hypothetical protein ZWY2020_015126 [Hordeum vulgare]|nr:hypothetical protein ZWY2020_015126 [Hordeum vulgare]